MALKWLAGSLLLLLAPAADDKAAQELLKAVRERADRAKSLRVEGRTTSVADGETISDLSFSIRIRGKDRWVYEVKDLGPGSGSFMPAVYCDGKKVLVTGTDVPGALKLDEGGEILRWLVTVGGVPSFETYLYRDPEEAVRPVPPVLADVKDGGTERVGEIQARVIEYSIRLEDQVSKVRLVVDPATKRPLRKEIADEGSKSVETYAAFAFDEDLPDSEFSFASPRRLARVRAGQVAKSVELYGLYTGRFPRSLDDLAARPAHLEPEVFWPEGGFVLGGVVPRDSWGRPYGLRAERGRARVVSLGSDGAPGGSGDAEDAEVAVGPVTRRPVGAPSDRLRRQYTARIQVQLLAAAVRAFRDATGELPRRKAALWETPDQLFLAGGKVPLDPWGSPYRIISDPGQVRVLVRDPKEHALALKQLTADETKKLESVARPRLGDDERKAVSALLDRLSEDDLEAREKAESELKAWGPAIASLLEERLKNEKDGEARLRVEQIRKAVPARRPAWMKELAALQLTLGANESLSTEGALLTSCQNNLSQLWKMQCVYMAQFGGRMKKMPDATGKDFWLALAKTMPPLIDESGLDIFVCPASGIAAERGVCTFRGPVRPVSRLADGDFVGICDDEAHGEQVVVLRKSGDTTAVPRGGAEHDEALRTTAP